LYIGIIKYYFSAIWIGLTDIKSEGTFLWENAGEAPDDLYVYGNGQEYDCVKFYYGEGGVFAEAVACEQKFAYVCKMSPCE
jgi:hypothetical protein